MTMIGKILICTWGYSMRLVDFYKVISETEKTVTVMPMTQKEVRVEGREPSYLTGYTVPDSIKTKDNFGREMKPFRLQRREIERANPVDGCYVEIVYRGSVDGQSSPSTLYVWDGKPAFYDHCD